MVTVCERRRSRCPRRSKSRRVPWRIPTRQCGSLIQRSRSRFDGGRAHLKAKLEIRALSLPIRQRPGAENSDGLPRFSAATALVRLQALHLRGVALLELLGLLRVALFDLLFLGVTCVLFC
jgi:hypothetical protein